MREDIKNKLIKNILEKLESIIQDKKVYGQSRKVVLDEINDFTRILEEFSE